MTIAHLGFGEIDETCEHERFSDAIACDLGRCVFEADREDLWAMLEMGIPLRRDMGRMPISCIRLARNRINGALVVLAAKRAMR